MKNLSVIIITKNEAKNIERALDSVTFADEIILVDSGSTDETLKIASKFKLKVYKQKWAGFAKQKEFALKKATCKWVLSIDADEEVTENLKNEILNAINSDEINGYNICRANYFLGKFIKHSGWFPDFQLRLFKKDKAQIINAEVHEGFKVKGKVSRLKSILNHYTYFSIEQYLTKQNFYTSLEVRNRLNRKKIRTINFIINPLSTFLRMYILKGGWRDGVRGLILASYSSLYTLLKYAKTWEAQLPKNKNENFS